MNTIKTRDGREIQVDFVDYYDDLWKSYNEGVPTREDRPVREYSTRICRDKAGYYVEYRDAQIKMRSTYYSTHEAAREEQKRLSAILDAEETT